MTTRFFRGDSASYYAPLLKYLVAEGIGFEVFTIPAKLAVHQSRLSVHASAAEPRLQELVAARQSLLDLALPPL